MGADERVSRDGTSKLAEAAGEKRRTKAVILHNGLFVAFQIIVMGTVIFLPIIAWIRAFFRPL